MRILLSLFLSIFIAWVNPASAGKAEVEAKFQNWLTSDLWPEAKAAGISGGAFKRALKGVVLNWKLPDLVVPGTQPPKAVKQSQAEFSSPGAYFSQKRLATLTASGQALASTHAGLLKKIEKKYGVPGSIILAIWGRESGYGRAKIPYSEIEVLATKAFMSTRTELFRKELIAALQMVEGGADPAMMRGSWAGAMGQPQFMPSSYLKYAVDFDGDGKRDIWNSVPDSLASIANYMALKGWQRGRNWGYEVTIPADVSCAQEGPDLARPIGDWASLGITRISQKAFPADEVKADGMMLVPAGRFGPQFIVSPNFYIIKDYNNSDLYALFIGNLADRISRGPGAFLAKWGEVGPMLRSDIETMQKRLAAKGHDVGKVDGLPGYKTRRSIGRWQSENGLKPTCFPADGLKGKI